MATAIMGNVRFRPVGRPAARSVGRGAARSAGSGWRAAWPADRLAAAIRPALATGLLAFLPWLLLPADAMTVEALVRAGLASLLFVLLAGLVDRTVLPEPAQAETSAWRQAALPLLGIALAAALELWLGQGVPVLAFVFLLLRAAGRPWRRHGLPVAALLAALAMGCRVEAAAQASGLVGQDWLVPLALAGGACLELAGARLRLAEAAAPGRLLQPGRFGQMRDLALVLLLGIAAILALALLAAPSRLAAQGAVLALLPAPFVLLLALRCGQVALTGRRPAELAPTDRALALGSLGLVASLVLGAWLGQG